MKVREAMTRNVQVADPTETIEQAAKLMADLDVGSLPVGQDDQLVGMITDRDIAVRAVATGKGPGTKVREVMSKNIKYCFDDEEIEVVSRNMGDIQVRRLPVIDRDKRLVGILSLGDMAVNDASAAARALGGVSRPAGAHNQR
ncbi:CBS domain-containing protein [Niveispirillum sp. KHB5.9]|uniref:CBS domain-containing protein n=1 Tax=Niveispirillum sp. KHB5.9 TaxID=3400269 RepID=UPI003A86C473